MKRWALDLEDGSLSSGSDVATLTPKAADVLLCLIKHAGTVTSRNQILREVWGDIHVSPDLVRDYIHEIRNALGDEARQPNYIETVGRRGFRLIGPVSVGPGGTTANQLAKRPNPLPVVEFCKSTDGASIAYARSGQGYPLLIAGSWMTHLDMDWDSPAYGDYIRHLSDRFQVIRYDQRGNGLSQWSDVDLSFDCMVDDMTVVIETLGYEKIAILGMSQGASVAIAYASRFPDKVSHLVFNGGYARGRRQRDSITDDEESRALVSLIRTNWANENPAIRQAVTTLFLPGASQEQMQWFNNFQKVCGPSDNIAAYRRIFDDMNVTGLLRDVKAPTLILHSDSDSAVPLSEGKLLADQIAGASFVQLKSPNHMLFESEEDFPVMIERICNFISV